MICGKITTPNGILVIEVSAGQQVPWGIETKPNPWWPSTEASLHRQAQHRVLAGAPELQKKQRREASLSSFLTITPVCKPLLQELARGHTNESRKQQPLPCLGFCNIEDKNSQPQCVFASWQEKKNSNKDAGKRKWLWLGSGILTLNRQVGPAQFRKPYPGGLFISERENDSVDYH